MTLYRRLILWLARKEIAALNEAIGKLHSAIADESIKNAVSDQRLELARRCAYAEGEMAGQAQAWASMAETIADRTGGVPDYINPEDLARAKKGILH